MSEDAYALDMDRETPIRPGARSPKTSASGLRPQSRSSALFDFFIKQGYLWDWIFAAIFIIVNYVVPTKAIPPVRRFYESNDPTLSYPNHESTVPGSALYVLTFLWPAVVVSVVAAIFRSWVDWHHIILTWAEAFALTTGFKRWMNLVGRLRPHWLAALASGDEAEIDDSRLSYPSGHAAYMFFSGTLLSLYLLGKTGILRKHMPGHFFFACLCLVPIGLATFVAVSRIADYKHNPSDVNAGCFIGMVCAIFCYSLNYPMPYEKDSHLPKSRAQSKDSS